MEIWGDIWNIHVDIGEYKEYVWILGDMQNMYGNIYYIYIYTRYKEYAWTYKEYK